MVRLARNGLRLSGALQRVHPNGTRQPPTSDRRRGSRWRATFAAPVPVIECVFRSINLAAVKLPGDGRFLITAASTLPLIAQVRVTQIGSSTACRASTLITAGRVRSRHT
jgi:hypothetical protein